MRSEIYGKMNYDKLWSVMERKKINKQYLLNHGLNKSTIYKLVRNDTITTETICKLCFLLNCKPSQILEYIPPEPDTTTGQE